jgi:hypothetical protein
LDATTGSKIIKKIPAVHSKIFLGSNPYADTSVELVTKNAPVTEISGHGRLCG